MIVAVTGGRDTTDREGVFAALDRVTPEITFLIHGGCRGLDSLAEQWAMGKGIHTAVVEANWDHYGPKAGPLRNEAMMSLGPSMLLAFPGGRGTANCIEVARKHGIFVLWMDLP